MNRCPWDDCIYPRCNVRMGCPPEAFQTKEYQVWACRVLGMIPRPPLVVQPKEKP